MSHLTTDPKTGIAYRTDTFDEWILNESKGYFPLGIQEYDKILDLGGHIGTFASRAMIEYRDVNLTSIEAEKSNWEVNAINSGRFGFFSVHGAIVDDPQDGNQIIVFVNDRKNNALHSTVPVRGRSTQIVKGLGFSKVLETVKPTIIKVDIEGAEYDLPWSKIKDSEVRLVVAELHLTHKGHRSLAQIMINDFKEMGFELVKIPRIGEKNWTTLATWKR